MQHTLKASGLVKGYSRRTVVRGISLELAQGEIVGLLGPNGAGKTTTFRMITGEIHAEEGSIWFDDNDITRWPMYRRARFGMAYFWLSLSDELRRPINEILGAGVRTERGVEVFYNYAVRPWLRLTPSLQVVQQGLPGRTAVLGAFRAEVRF